jgi:hypothetical protein
LFVIIKDQGIAMSIEISYINVSNDPDAEKRLVHAPEMVEELRKLGFRRICLIAAVYKSDKAIQMVRDFIEPEDAKDMIHFIESGEVIEILEAKSQSAIAFIDRSITGPIVCFETMLANGIVIETVMKPGRAPRPRPIGTARRWSEKLLLWLNPDPPIWPHPNNPSCDYYVELVNTSDISEQWNIHQKRVLEKLDGYHTSLPSHNSIAPYLAIRKRFWGIQAFQRRWFPRFLVPVLLLFTILYITLMSWILFLLEDASLPYLLVILTPWLLFCFTFLLTFLFVSKLLIHWIIPHLPTAPVQADELFSQENGPIHIS